MKHVSLFLVVSSSEFSNLHFTLDGIFQHVPGHWIPRNFTEAAVFESS